MGTALTKPAWTVEGIIPRITRICAKDKRKSFRVKIKETAKT